MIDLLAQVADRMALHSPPTWEALGAEPLDVEVVQTAALVAVAALGHQIASIPAAAAAVWPAADTQ